MAEPSEPMSTAVVVGVSPTTGSPAALRWGLDEALLRRVPLRAVMAWRPPRPPGSAGGRPPAGLSTSDDYAGDADKQLREFVETALGPDAEVDCSVVKGNAVTALLSAAEQAQLLVVGEPRPGRLNSVRASLVAPQVVHKAKCPVVVMPPGMSVVG